MNYIQYRADGSESIEFIDFAKSVEEYINNDIDIINNVKEDNLFLYNELQKMINDEINIDYCGTYVYKVLSNTPRFSYIKNLEYNGKKYEAEIDNLRRHFDLIQV